MKTFLDDLISALTSSGMGVNIIVVNYPEQKDEEEETDSFPDDPYDIFSGGIGGGGPMESHLFGGADGGPFTI